MDCVTPLGIGRDAYWGALRRGESGVRRIESFDVTDSPVQIAAEVRGFDWGAQLSPKDRRHVPRTVPLALAAAREALADAGIQPDDLRLDERRETGVVLGTGGGGLAFTEQQYAYYFAGNKQKASVYTRRRARACVVCKDRIPARLLFRRAQDAPVGLEPFAVQDGAGRTVVRKNPVAEQ